MAHQPERPLDARLGDQPEEWRLFELYGQALAKRSVKHGVARRVCEIGQDNRVLIRKFWRAVEIEVTRDAEHQHHGGSRDDQGPTFCGVLRAGRRQTRIRVALEALEVGANIRSMLVAQPGGGLQAFGYDTFQFRRRVGPQPDRAFEVQARGHLIQHQPERE